MLQFNTLNTEKIYLRKLTQNDATEEYCSWLNDNDVTQYLETHETNIDKLIKYINDKNGDINCILFGIFDINNGKHIGNIKLEPIDWKNKIAEVGIMIGNKDYWGKKVGYEALKLIIDYSFNKFDISEIILGLHFQNSRALKLYLNLNFKIYEIIDNKIIRMKINKYL